MAAEPAARRQGPLSLWAALSLLCGASIVCPLSALAGLLPWPLAVPSPVFSLLAVPMALLALRDLRRHPQRTGRAAALAGLVLGLAGLAGCAWAARWWHEHAREPMMTGPADATARGLAGDVDGFQSAFTGPGATAPDVEAEAFLAEVAGRYGRLRAAAQRETPAPQAPDAPPASPDFSRARIAYTWEFDTGPVPVESEFVVLTDDGSGLVLKFAWLVLRDAERGDLIYPASAAGLIDEDSERDP